MTKRVSVCMGTYNGALYIEEQVRSVLSQLGPNDELIISDDDSTDRTIKIIESFHDRRIRIVPSQRFRSTARNFENALKWAEGDFIFLCDQDDIWYPNKVEAVLANLVNNDLVLTDCQVIDAEGNIIHNSFFKNRGSRPGFIHNIWKNSYLGCCISFKRDMLTYILPIPRNIYYHDWWIGIIVELQGKPFFYSQPLIKYRRHSSNMTATGVGSDAWGKRIKNRFWLGWHVIKRSIVLR